MSQGYAVIETGGKQYKVSTGDRIAIELLSGSGEEQIGSGSDVTFDRVLAVKPEGGSLKVGTPVVSGASVSAKVLNRFKGEKLVAFKKKRRQGYRRKIGHRQNLLHVEIAAISG